jgi:inner membrane transporter RhtA
MSRRVPPHLYFVVSAIFHYLGPAFAVLLFARVEVLGVAWLRIASAALIFALWRAPLRTFVGLDSEGRRLLLGWGAVLALMNCCFYLAIDRLPLGTVAAIEFLPVILLAALGARSARNVAALALAVPGVYLLTDVQLQADPLGVAFAGANAVLFAAYIVLGHRVSRLGDGGGISGLAAAMAIAAIVATPIGGWEAAPALASPVVLAAGVGVGIASSVIPYVTDQLAMARLERATYALLVSLLPATATVIGVLVLGQIPTAVEVAGVALVVVGVAIHREPGDGRTSACHRCGLRKAAPTQPGPGLRSVGAVGEDVHDGSARLAKHEAPDSPVLVAQRVGDLKPPLDRPVVDRVDVVHLDRDAGRGRIVVADDVHLDGGVGRRCHGHDPADVHGRLEAEQPREEVARLGGTVRPDVRHCPCDPHAAVLSKIRGLRQRDGAGASAMRDERACRFPSKAE